MVFKIASGLIKVIMNRFDGVGKVKGGKFTIGYVKKKVFVEKVSRKVGSTSGQGSSQESEKVFFTLADNGRLTLDKDGLFYRFQHLIMDWDIAHSQSSNVLDTFRVNYVDVSGELIDRAQLLEEIIERAIFHILPRLTTNLIADFKLCDRILGIVEKCYCCIMCSECMAAQNLGSHLAKGITESAPRWFFGCRTCTKWNTSGFPLTKTRVFLPLGGTVDTRSHVQNMFDSLLSHWEIYDEEGVRGGLVFPIFGRERVLLEAVQEKVKNLLSEKARKRAQELVGIDWSVFDLLNEYNL